MHEDSLDFENALLSLVQVEKTEDGYKVHADEWVGKVENGGEYHGDVSYDAALSASNDDAVITGGIKLVFDTVEYGMFGKEPYGSTKINNVALDEPINEIIEGGAKFLGSRQL